MKKVKKSEKEKIDSYFFHRRWIGTANIRHFAKLLELKKMSARQLYDFYPSVFIDNEKYQKEKEWYVGSWHIRRARFFLKYEIIAAEVNHQLEINRKLIMKKRAFYIRNGKYWLK